MHAENDDKTKDNKSRSIFGFKRRVGQKSVWALKFG